MKTSGVIDKNLNHPECSAPCIRFKIWSMSVLVSGPENRSDSFLNEAKILS